MRCLTLIEAKNVLGAWLDERGKPGRGGPNMKSARFYVGAEPFTKVYWLASHLLECLGPWEEAWLWLDGPDTWNRQGMHLYMRLRQPYGDLRLVSEAPAQQFYAFEGADLCSFVAVALMNEWSFCVVTSHDYGRLFVSQSSGVEVWFNDDNQLNALQKSLGSNGIGVDTGPAAQGR